jgi:tetratricopeptide (TPR) repeat protein
MARWGWSTSVGTASSVGVSRSRWSPRRSLGTRGRNCNLGTFGDAVFLAMELVDGDTLEVWLTRPRRWQHIVDVFLQAARGLEAAHAVGLAHGNVRPSNVLVGNDGRVRVFDFGVAADPSRADVRDPRADQYALCVALHDALFGKRVASADRATPRTIGRPPGWLNHLVQRGRHPDPEQRFPSLAQLRIAVERGFARRRHRRAAGVAIGVLAIVGATAVVGYLRGHDASVDRCPHPALAAWSIARKTQVATAIASTGAPHAPAVAQRVAAVLDQFAAAWQRQERDTCLAFEVGRSDDRATHGRRAACLDRDRFVFEAVVDRFAAADRKMVDKANALLAVLPEVERCARTDAPAWPADPTARVRFTHHLQEAARIQSLSEAGQTDAAAHDVPALVRDASSLGVPSAEAKATYLAGRIAAIRGQLPEGARLVEQALWKAEAARNDELVVQAACELMHNIGSRQRRPADARRFVDLVRAAADRVGSPAARARAQRAIGILELGAGNVSAADVALRSALALSEAAVPRDPFLAAVLTMDLANVEYRRGHHGEVEKRLRVARSAFLEQLGAFHPEYGQLLNNLGNALLELDRYDDAAQVFDEAVAVLERALGPDHQYLATALSNGSTAHAAHGDHVRARAMIERSIAILERTHASPVVLGAALFNLAEVAALQGGQAEAEALYRRTLALQRERLGDRHPDVTESLLRLAQVVLDRGDLAEAARLCEAAVRSGSTNRAVQGAIETCRGKAAAAAGHAARAVELLERAVTLGREGEDPARLADAQFALARVLPASAVARAIELARAARPGYERQHALRAREIAQVDAWLRTHTR